ncbi:MAG: spermidine synthase [Thermoanaerobaculia bacterium]
MIPWTLLDRAAVPGSRDEMRLYQRGDEFSIRVANYELMNSRVHGSEEALSELAWKKIGDRPKPRVLIGGLGLGYTLAAVLRLAGPKAQVVVAELVPEVVEWNRGPLAALAGHPLDDPRVTVRVADVGAIIREERDGFDAILLDVDNGPQALTSEDNHRLYDLAGLRATQKALRDGGVLGIWASGPDPAFVAKLRQLGFAVDEVRARARGDRGKARYVIWIAERPKERAQRA